MPIAPSIDGWLRALRRRAVSSPRPSHLKRSNLLGYPLVAFQLLAARRRPSDSRNGARRRSIRPADAMTESLESIGHGAAPLGVLFGNQPSKSSNTRL